MWYASPVGKTSQIIVPLTPEECMRLQTCEKTIREGLGTFVAVGRALMEIRDFRLYRQQHHTFENYVQSVLALSRPRAYELIDSAQVVADLSAIADISQLPQNEGQARELRRWKNPNVRVEKWKSVLDAAGSLPLTAKFIRLTLRPTKATASTDNPGLRTKACLARLRGIVSGSPVETKALNLISKLEETLSKVTEEAPIPAPAPKKDMWLPGFDA